ncbi:P-loop containing nucleoside triphosphate hydrolase protein [Hypoxylon crocopeplum]|nr:P-loop containing nucleoside triphosphate hydrolase protein [Hypoxylon crocopeplum]
MEYKEMEIRKLMDKLRAEEKRRRLLFEELQKLRGTIRVICRIRPVDGNDELFEYKIEKGEFHDHPAKLTVREDEKGLHGELKSIWSATYEFERIFLPGETNGDVFGEISNFVQSVIDGKKACIFCYGQSGTGKTYTMSNLDDVEDREEGVDFENDGIIPRVKTMLFRGKNRLNELGIDMDAQGCCYEIYNNELWLLKSSGSEKKRILKAERDVKDPEFTILNSAKDFDDMVEAGMKNRHFGATGLNDTSSRSHFIIRIKTTVRGSSGEVREGLLHLVDLAGSEKTRDAGTAGARLQEGTNINVSLSALRKVFADLAEGRRPVYNGNILTELLQHTLGPDCMTLMLVMINPLAANWPATKYTLQIALTEYESTSRKASFEQVVEGNGESRGYEVIEATVVVQGDKCLMTRLPAPSG